MTDAPPRPVTGTPGTKEWRSFGLVVGGVFALLGAWPAVVRGDGLRIWALGLAALLVGPALVYPGALKHPHRAWMTFGHLLGWINTRIILTLVFYGVFTPVGVVLRVFGKDPMRRKFDPTAATYRLVRAPRPGSHMRHQF